MEDVLLARGGARTPLNWPTRGRSSFGHLELLVENTFCDICCAIDTSVSRRARVTEEG